MFSLVWFPFSQYFPKRNVHAPRAHHFFGTVLFQDVSAFEEGIGPLTFKSLRVVSFPGGQQYGSINPCEMNEFSDECDVWEEANGAYVKKDYMIKSNERTKGR
jgi:hypothetical protein